MTLTAESTLAEVQAQYDDNADYDLNGSVAQAKLFIQACRLLLRRMADSASKDGEQFSNAYQKIQGQLDAALAWWRTNDVSVAGQAGGRTRHLSFNDFRT